jgi:hypothetical protein
MHSTFPPLILYGLINLIILINKTNECTILTTFIMAYVPSPYTCFRTL